MKKFRITLEYEERSIIKSKLNEYIKNSERLDYEHRIRAAKSILKQIETQEEKWFRANTIVEKYRKLRSAYWRWRNIRYFRNCPNNDNNEEQSCCLCKNACRNCVHLSPECCDEENDETYEGYCKLGFDSCRTCGSFVDEMIDFVENYKDSHGNTMSFIHYKLKEPKDCMYCGKMTRKQRVGLAECEDCQKYEYEACKICKNGIPRSKFHTGYTDLEDYVEQYIACGIRDHQGNIIEFNPESTVSAWHVSVKERKNCYVKKTEKWFCEVCHNDFPESEIKTLDEVLLCPICYLENEKRKEGKE